MGKTVSWTSDINGQWSRNFLTWNKGAQLIKNSIYWTIPDLSDEGKVSITQSGNEAVVEFYSDSIKDGSKIKGVYNNEKGESGEVELTQEEPGKFVGRVKLNDLGFYTFNIREDNNGEVLNNYNGAFSLQYSDEYKFNKNKDKINTLVSEVKGSFINKPKEVFQGEFKSSYKPINLTVPALIVAILLFLFDIAYRRLNLDLEKYFNKFKIRFNIDRWKFNRNAINNKRGTDFSNSKVKGKEDKTDLDSNKMPNSQGNEDIIDKRNDKINKKKKVPNAESKTERLDTSSLLKNKKKRDY